MPKPGAGDQPAKSFQGPQSFSLHDLGQTSQGLCWDHLLVSSARSRVVVGVLLGQTVARP